MKLRMWQVDAFTDHRFGGNPAAVVPLDAWLSDSVMQSIAAENNLSETAFFVAENGGYHLRWFTPAMEVPLCGHATLASAAVVFAHLLPEATRVEFHSKSGPLVVTREGDKYALDFPEYACDRIDVPRLLSEALGAAPAEAWLGPKMMAVFERVAQVKALQPDFRKIAAIGAFGVIATAPGDDCDFVSRYFVPQGGVDEDPVTGSAHCQLTPYWAKRLGNPQMFARQVSARGGELWVEHLPPRVRIAGHAVEYLSGTIEI
jgi:PhzF family phenazine biosynthesis protein